jgi:phage shock protein PspC (stress-responsive transcriptional regulator)
MNAERPDGALLAGVCAGIARALKWNVWVLRALFICFLIIKTVPTVVVYAGLALLFYFFNSDWSIRDKKSTELGSPELTERNERISELERRFRELEDSDR